MKTKQLILSLIAILIAEMTFAQSGFNYKALITDNGNALANQNLSIKFTILQNSATTVYQETQTTTTDANGIVSVSIGEGSLLAGNFDNIDWQNDLSLKVEINTGSGFQNFGTNELKYVPTAKYADKAGNVFSGDYTDLNNKPAVFTKLDGNMAQSLADNIKHSGVLRLGDYYGAGANGKLVVENYTNTGLSNYRVGANFIVGDGATHSHYHIGIQTHLKGTDNSAQYANYNIIDNTGHYPQYGVYNILTGTADASIFSNYNKIDNTSNGEHFGTYNELTGTGSGQQYGVMNHLSEGTGMLIGITDSIVNASNNTHIGVNNYLSEGTGINYGTKNVISAGTTTAPQYGTYNKVTGTGSAVKYGSYNIIPSSTAGYGTAVYGEATNGIGKYAGHFKGNVKIESGLLNINNSNATIKLENGTHTANFNRFNNRLYIGSNDMIQMGTNGDVRLDFQIAHNGNVSIGTTSSTGRLNINPIGNINNNGSLDFTKAGLLVGTSTNGIGLDSNQIESKGSALHLNYLSGDNVTLAYGGGNVGIGTATPDETLVVKTADSVAVKLSAANAKKARLQLYESGNYGFELEYDGANDQLNLWSKKYTGLEAIRTTWKKNGEVELNGKITSKSSRNNADLKAFAYGNLRWDFTNGVPYIENATNNFSISLDRTGVFQVRLYDVNGQEIPFSYNNYTVVATIHSIDPVIITSNKYANRLYFYTSVANGTAITQNFSFIIYKK